MDQFLDHEALRIAIPKLLSEVNVRCAVAFWGRGAEDNITPDARVICNLKSGGTNPFVLKALIKTGVTIRQCNRLHAQVYIGNDYAIVASANASANGMGLEGTEQTSWIEAGVRLDNVSPISHWFEEL